jgi:hypothetical protein
VIAEVQRREAAPGLTVRSCLIGADRSRTWVIVRKGTDSEEREEVARLIRKWRDRPFLAVYVLDREAESERSDGDD